MLTGRVEGRLLQMLVRVSGAKRVVEIGTYTGFSALMMADGLSDTAVFVPSRFFDNLQPQGPAEFRERFFEIAVDGDSMPAKSAPLVEQLADVATDFRDELSTASVFAIEITHCFSLMDDQLLLPPICAKGCRHVAGGQK